MFIECIFLKTYSGEFNQNRMEITDNNICVYREHIGQQDTHTQFIYYVPTLDAHNISDRQSGKIVTTTYACLGKIVSPVG